MRRPRLRPWLVLWGSLLLTAGAALLTHTAASARDEARFENAVRGVEERTRARLETYVVMLRGVGGLFGAQDGDIAGATFRRYVEELELAQRYPGVQGIGFTRRIPAAELARQVAAVRAERFPDFHVWPDTPRAEYHAIVFLEPLDRRNRAAIGYDMFTEPTRREAMLRAWLEGNPAMSGKVTLVQEIDEPKQAGFLIYVPVYEQGAHPATVEERQATLRGFAYSPFRAGDLFAQLFGTGEDPRVAFQAYDGLEAFGPALLYDSAPERWTRRARFTAERQLDLNGHPWTLRYASLPSLEAMSATRFARWIGMGGALMSFVLFALARGEAKARAQSEQAAEELRQAQVAIEAERGRLRALVENAPAAVAMLQGPDHLYVMSNGINDALLGGQPLLGRKAREVLPKSGDWLLALLHQVYRTGEPVTRTEAEVLMPDADGAPRSAFLNLVYQPTRNASGQVDGVATFAVDVTEIVQARKRAEELALKLTHSEWLFRALVENLPQLAWSALPNGDIDYYNRRWYEYTGTTYEQMRGAGWKSIIEPSALPEAEARFDRSIRTGEPFELEYPLRGADGQYRWFLSRMQPLRDPEGRIVRWFGTNTNTDERRKHATALEEAVQARDRFLAIAGHELNTPLTSLKLNLDALERTLSRPNGFKPETVAGKLEKIHRQLGRLANLVKELLDVSRITGGRLVLEPEEMDLVALAREVVERSQEDALHAGCELVLHAPSHLAGRWDRLRLDQVLQNLLSNAIKYGRGKPVELELREEGDFASFHVTDHGIGIAPEDHARLFMRFERVASERNYGGFGLGLWIVKQVLDAMGGTIEVKSAHGQGSTFRVRVPRGLQ